MRRTRCSFCFLFREGDLELMDEKHSLFCNHKSRNLWHVGTRFYFQLLKDITLRLRCKILGFMVAPAPPWVANGNAGSGINLEPKNYAVQRRKFRIWGKCYLNYCPCQTLPPITFFAQFSTMEEYLWNRWSSGNRRVEEEEEEEVKKKKVCELSTDKMG